MCAADPCRGRFLAASINYRGRVNKGEIDHSTYSTLDKNSGNFCEWIPNNVKYEVYDRPSTGARLSSTLLANSTAIQEVIKQFGDIFTSNYKRYPFVQNFFAEGMDEVEFFEAEMEMNNLVAEYQLY